MGHNCAGAHVQQRVLPHIRSMPKCEAQHCNGAAHLACEYLAQHDAQCVDVDGRRQRRGHKFWVDSLLVPAAQEAADLSIAPAACEWALTASLRALTASLNPVWIAVH